MEKITNEEEEKDDIYRFHKILQLNNYLNLCDYI